MSRRKPAKPGDRLTQRELDVLAQVRLGCTNSEIAQALGISEYTVWQHVSRLFRKTNSRNRTELSHYTEGA